MSALQFDSFRRDSDSRKGVLAYIRVSSPDQAERRASLEEQRRKIKAHFEDKMRLTILDWYADEGLSASKDHEAREGFWAMIERAKSDKRVGIIAVDDEMRFFRDKYLTATVKGDLLSHGVVVYTTTRTVDPRTMPGLWQETIEETMAHADNILRRESTMRGMAGNIRERDPNTGWAFKNGGKAPYGWKNVRIDMGRDSRGRPVGRTIWELDAEAAEVRRRILLWRKDGWTYQQIRDELNRLAVPAPRGGLWSDSTIVGFCREDMIWTAAGYTIWNKHYRKHAPQGEKFKPTDEWVVEPKAHPAIISEEEAKAILDVNKKRRIEHERGERNSQQSPYLIRGNNSDDIPLFICGVCGGRVIPWSAGGRNRPRYSCSTKVYKGAKHCETPRIDAGRLESALIEMLSRRFTREFVIAVIDAANEAAKKEQGHSPVIDHREKRLDEIETQLRRIQESILSGVDPALWTEQMNKLGQEKKEIERSLTENPPDVSREQKYRPIGHDEAERIADELAAALHSPDMPERRRVVVSLVRQLTLTADGMIYADLHPDPLNLEAPTLFAMYGNSLVPPTGFEPVLPP